MRSGVEREMDNAQGPCRVVRLPANTPNRPSAPSTQRLYSRQAIQEATAQMPKSKSQFLLSLCPMHNDGFPQCSCEFDKVPTVIVMYGNWPKKRPSV